MARQPKGSTKHADTLTQKSLANVNYQIKNGEEHLSQNVCPISFVDLFSLNRSSSSE